MHWQWAPHLDEVTVPWEETAVHVRAFACPSTHGQRLSGIVVHSVCSSTGYCSVSVILEAAPGLNAFTDCT